LSSRAQFLVGLVDVLLDRLEVPALHGFGAHRGTALVHVLVHGLQVRDLLIRRLAAEVHRRPSELEVHHCGHIRALSLTSTLPATAAARLSLSGHRQQRDHKCSGETEGDHRHKSVLSHASPFSHW